MERKMARFVLVMGKFQIPAKNANELLSLGEKNRRISTMDGGAILYVEQHLAVSSCSMPLPDTSCAAIAY